MEIINEIYHGINISEGFSRSIFVALPKKPVENECKLHKTISLIGHITKLIWILMNKEQSRIILEL